MSNFHQDISELRKQRNRYQQYFHLLVSGEVGIEKFGSKYRVFRTLPPFNTSYGDTPELALDTWVAEEKLRLNSMRCNSCKHVHAATTLCGAPVQLGLTRINGTCECRVGKS